MSHEASSEDESPQPISTRRPVLLRRRRQRRL